MSLLKISIKRLYQPEGETTKYASIRDWQVKSAIKSGRGIEISCKGEKMIVPSSGLDNYKCNGKVFRSRFGERAEYRLLDFEWKPILSKQTSLL